jgi:hypothetical protein
VGVDDVWMAAGAESAQKPDEWVVSASFDSRRRAEFTLARLGRGFRKQAREGQVVALVVSENADGSLKVTQSRAVTASGFLGTILRLSMMWMIGWLGLFSAAKGVQGGVHATRLHQGRIGSDELQAHELLGVSGPHSALVLVRGKGVEGRQAVVAAEQAQVSRCWDGTLVEFLAGLDPGTAHDWVRTAFGAPPRGTEGAT